MRSNHARFSASDIRCNGLGHSPRIGSSPGGIRVGGEDWVVAAGSFVDVGSLTGEAEDTVGDEAFIVVFSFEVGDPASDTFVI